MEKAWSDSRPELWELAVLGQSCIHRPPPLPDSSRTRTLSHGAGSSEGNVFAVLASALLSSTLLLHGVQPWP